MSVDGEERISSWRNRPAATDSVAVSLAAGPHHWPSGYYQGTADFVLRLSAEPMDERAVELMAGACTPLPPHAAVAAPAGRHSGNRPATSPGRTWYRRGGDRVPTPAPVDRADQARSTLGIARALAPAAASRAATDPAAVSAQVLQQAKAVRPGGEAEANALLDLARAELAAGRPRGDAVAKLSQAVEPVPGLHPGAADRRGRDFVRYAQLQALGAASQPTDGSLAAQVLCAADEMLRNEPRPTSPVRTCPPRPSITASCRGTRPRPEQRRRGRRRLARRAAPADLEPGLYVLSVQIDGAGPGGGPLTQALGAAGAVGVDLLHRRGGIGLRPQHVHRLARPRAAWRADPTGLALLDALKAGPLPPARRTASPSRAREGQSAAGAVPFEATACDGMRLWVDDHERVIHAWPMAQPARSTRPSRPRRPHARPEGGLLQGERRLQALAAGRAADAGRPGAGGPPRRQAARATEQALQEQDDALAVDPQNVAAFALRGGLHARDRAWDEAAADYTRPPTSTRPTHCGRSSGHWSTSWPVTRTATSSSARRCSSGWAGSRRSRDRSIAARFVITALLDRRNGRAPPALAEWVARATPQPQPNGSSRCASWRRGSTTTATVSGTPPPNACRLPRPPPRRRPRDGRPVPRDGAITDPANTSGP